MSIANFCSSYRVYYEDTDAGGVVYHANYLGFMERARTDWLTSLGCTPQQPTDKWGIIFAVRSAFVDYLRPARLGDLLKVSVSLDSIHGASMNISQCVAADHGVLVRGEFRIACLDAEKLTVRRLPAELKEKLT